MNLTPNINSVRLIIPFLKYPLLSWSYKQGETTLTVLF